MFKRLESLFQPTEGIVLPRLSGRAAVVLKALRSRFVEVSNRENKKVVVFDLVFILFLA